MSTTPNKPAAANPGWRFQFCRESRWRSEVVLSGVAEPERWTKERLRTPGRQMVSSVPRQRDVRHCDSAMSIRPVVGIALLVLLLATGCRSTNKLGRVDALRRDPSWSTVRAAAEMEIARRVGSTNWSHSAYYTPKEHTNGVWVVVASGAYPNNTLGDSIDLLIRDSGEVVTYTPRMSWHPR